MDGDERRLNNTIFLMYVVMDSYRKAHNLSVDEFLELDEKHDILKYVAECPEVFDSMTESEMVEEIDQYIS